MNKLLENINNWVQSGPTANDKHQINLSTIKGYMQPVQATVDKLGGAYDEMVGLSRNIMDPQSAMNQQRFDLMRQQSQEQLALQNLLARRKAASMGQDSGITFQNAIQRQQDTGRSLLSSYQQGMLGQQNLGLNVLGQSQGMPGDIMQGQMGIQENIAQGYIANQELKQAKELAEAERKSQFGGGLLGGVLQGATMYLTNKLNPLGF